MPDRELISGNPQPEDLQFEAGLRPRRLGDFTGQSKLKENLSIAIERSAIRSRAPPAATGRFHRTEQAQGESLDRHRGRPYARRSHGPRAALRTARPG